MEPEIETPSWLEFSVSLSEADDGVMDIDVTMHPEDRLIGGTARPPAVGAIIQLKPHIQAALT